MSATEVSSSMMASSENITNVISVPRLEAVSRPLIATSNSILRNYSRFNSGLQSSLSVEATCPMDFQVSAKIPSSLCEMPKLQTKNGNASGLRISSWPGNCGSCRYTSDSRSLVPFQGETLKLPLTEGKFKDIPSVSHNTMARVLKGKYGGPFLIVDCRYPYEYEGGHIMGAKNVYTKSEMDEILFPIDIQSHSIFKPTLIFHCEFSSVRGPSMFRFVRNKDKQLNNGSDKSLYYPNMYLLRGGYCAFYANHKKFCCPETYKLMADNENIKDFVHFFVRSKLVDKEKSPEEALAAANSIVEQYFPKACDDKQKKDEDGE